MFYTSKEVLRLGAYPNAMFSSKGIYVLKLAMIQTVLPFLSDENIIDIDRAVDFPEVPLPATVENLSDLIGPDS